MNDSAILLSGRATFTLEGKGLRWTFQVAKSKDEERPAFFAKMLTGSDNESDFTYLGMLDPATKHVRLTRASKMAADSVPVRAMDWAANLMLTGRTSDIERQGFRVLWASTCARCGRTLTVPSSIDSRLGPECAKHVQA